MKSRSLAHPSRVATLAAAMLALAAPSALAWGAPQLDAVPLDSLARTFVSLRIQPEHPCAGDTVTLQLVENGCPPCVHLRSFGFSPAESTIAGLIDWTPVCNELRCESETLSMSLGALAAGTFRVLTSMTVVVHQLPEPDTSIHFQLPIQFEVGRDCGGPPPLCVTREMFSNVPPHQCAVTLAPGAAGDVPLYYESQVPIAAMEGNIEVPYPFQLTDLTLASHLTGVHLSRQRHTGGFRWLVFCDPGVTLAPGARMRLLDATVAAVPGAPDGASALMFSTITLASDEDGHALPLCIRQTLDFAAIATRLCVAGEPSVCDVNDDGRLDVRDLVRMVGCLVPHCADTSCMRPCVDCDSSGVFDLTDIFCCARDILRGPLVPPDSVQSDARVSVAFDTIETDGSDLLVSVRVRGARALGAAVLRFNYPGNHWRASPRMALPAGPRPVDVDWFPIVDVSEPGRIHIGGVRLGDSGPDEFMFTLAMTPLAVPFRDPTGNDRLETVAADLAARDGSVIRPLGGLPTITLEPGDSPGGPALQLSPARPNPFNSSTTFVVQLPESAPVDLAVHDLAGRRIATIAHATYAAGVHPFTWDGAGAHDGLYFVRLSVNGQVLSSRVAMLKGTRP